MGFSKGGVPPLPFLRAFDRELEEKEKFPESHIFVHHGYFPHRSGAYAVASAVQALELEAEEVSYSRIASPHLLPPRVASAVGVRPRPAAEAADAGQGLSPGEEEDTEYKQRLRLIQQQSGARQTAAASGAASAHPTQGIAPRTPAQGVRKLPRPIGWVNAGSTKDTKYTQASPQLSTSSAKVHTGHGSTTGTHHQLAPEHFEEQGIGAIICARSHRQGAWYARPFRP
ncbi:MAG: hypothetical protein SGPRY_006279 [Prymnesium sp.]